MPSGDFLTSKRIASSWRLAGSPVALLVGQPRLQKQEKAARQVGHVIQATSAIVDTVNLTVGTTLYNGEHASPPPSGSMRASVRSSQIAMPASSSATLEECTDELHVLVNQGTVNFTASASDKMELIIAQGIVRPADGQSASGQISIVPARGHRLGDARLVDHRRRRESPDHSRRENLRQSGWEMPATTRRLPAAKAPSTTPK